MTNLTYAKSMQKTTYLGRYADDDHRSGTGVLVVVLVVMVVMVAVVPVVMMVVLMKLSDPQNSPHCCAHGPTLAPSGTKSRSRHSH